MDENSKTETRDLRYKNILRGQLGETGIPLIVTYSFMLLLSLFVIILTSIGFIVSQSDAESSCALTSPALVL